jgi:hypothetical protein
VDAKAREERIKQKAADMMAMMMGGGLSDAQREAAVARAADLAEQHKLATSGVTAAAAVGGALDHAGGADARAGDLDGDGVGVGVDSLLADGDSGSVNSDGEEEESWDPRKPERSPSFDTATELHNKQDADFRASLAGDMIRSRLMFVPMINAAHDELADRLAVMERVLDAEALALTTAVWIAWGFIRVDSDGVIGYELDDPDVFSATLAAAEREYKLRVREARLARLSPGGSGKNKK